MTTGIILFAHGSRDALWSKPIEAIAQAVHQASPECVVRCAYLELMTPSLDSAVSSMVALGITRIRITPLFFGIGKHVREDLPTMMAALQNAHPDVELKLRPSIGEHPDLIAAAAKILIEAV